MGSGPLTCKAKAHRLCDGPQSAIIDLRAVVAAEACLQAGIRTRHGGQAPRPRAYESFPAAGGYAANCALSHSLPRPLFRNRSLARASPSEPRTSW
jgi:hypothetical protein